MNDTKRGVNKAGMWPPHLYPAINHTNTVAQRGSLTTKRSCRVATEHLGQRLDVARRGRSFSCAEDSRILRNINDIIELVNTAKIDSDDTSTCESQTYGSDKNGRSKLVNLLAARLQEIKNLQLTKDAQKPTPRQCKEKSRTTGTDPQNHKTSDSLKLRASAQDNVQLEDKTEFHEAIQRAPSVTRALYKRPIVNVAYAKLDTALVKAAAKRLRWDICDSPSGGDIFWFAVCLTELTLKEQTKSLFGVTYKKVTINRFADIQSAARKTLFACLTDIYDRYTEEDRHLYSPVTSPKTYLFPRGNNKVVRALRSGVPMILKPSAGSMGNGIKVVTSPEQIPPAVARGNSYICQVYIARPMLIDARKFDFRVYILLTNIGGGFHAMLSTLGIVRICTRPYQCPDRENCDDPYIHLTNYSINRHHEHYHRSTHVEDTKGNKRTLRSVLEALSKTHGVDIKDIWNQITTIGEAAVSILYPVVQLNSNQSDAYSFQIMGLDLLLDERGKMWLLEVNANPSLQYMYNDNNSVKYDVVDHHVKVSLVEECLKLVHRMRCGFVYQGESGSWIELRVRIPPEIGEVTALYAEYKTKYPSEELDCEEWVRFCKDNGLLAVLRDAVINQRENIDGTIKSPYQEAKNVLRNTFFRTHTRSPVKGFPEFLSQMEALREKILLEIGLERIRPIFGRSDVTTTACDLPLASVRWSITCSSLPTSETRMSASNVLPEALEGVSEEDARLILHLSWLYGGYSMRTRKNASPAPQDPDESDYQDASARRKYKTKGTRGAPRRVTTDSTRPKTEEPKKRGRKPKALNSTPNDVASASVDKPVDEYGYKATTEEGLIYTKKRSNSGTHTPDTVRPNYRDDTSSCSTCANTSDSIYDCFRKEGELVLPDRRRPRWGNQFTLKDKINKFIETGVATRTDVCDGSPNTLSICTQFELSNHEAMVADVDRVHYYRAAIFWSGHDNTDGSSGHLTKDSVSGSNFDFEGKGDCDGNVSSGEGDIQLYGKSSTNTSSNSADINSSTAVSYYCNNKKVLEVGTGPMCVLAMNALNAGAKFVDALEVSSSAARLAGKLMAAYGVSNKIRVFNCHSKNFFFDTASFFGLTKGDQFASREVVLPKEPPYDMIISEILGDFCSQEGVADVILDIQRRILFNNPEYIKKVKSIPTAASTMFVPCVFPDADNVMNKALLHDEMTIFSPSYKMMQSVGLKIDNLQLCTDWRIFEELHLEEWMQPQMCQHYESCFTITSSGPMCGFLVGIDVEIRPNEHFGTKFGHCESWYSNIILYDKEYHVHYGDIVVARSVANLTNYMTANCLGDKIQASRPSYSVRSYILSPVRVYDLEIDETEVFVYEKQIESRRMSCPCIADCSLQPVTSVPLSVLSQINMDSINSECLEPDDWLQNYQWVRMGEELYKIRVRPPIVTIDYKEQTCATFQQVPSAKRKLPTDPSKGYKKVKSRM
ncbi:Tubulin polyglutamylase TTLL6 [Babesia sp. Xinjiang]|uniref:Tubulin polyglutamylase TTLL6 n=1 Tax=Babesia sp. Xinjiang TaxID=462227 RepID=UPI000A25CA2F|nr:Tubulin polyglutamylase TTLL6 [Babesia sp. Xinjiang]ORM40173.1 Tubulin polyglutamylase TTLL6 [Babesia sp. Xinjiang]